MRKIIVTAFIAVTTMLGLGLGINAAYASGTEPCGNEGTGYCINAWNGDVQGNAVKMYYGNSSNENWNPEAQFICPTTGQNVAFVTTPGDSNGGTTYCPFGNHDLDTSLDGLPIYEFQYQSTNNCVVTNTSGYAVIGACGANGTYNVVVPNTGCGNQGSEFGYIVNKYWADQGDNSTEGWQSNGFKTQLQLDGNSTNTCWGIGLG